MSATIIDGKATAEALKSAIASRVSTLAKQGITPGLTVIIVGDDAASQVYVGSKIKQTKALGMNSNMIALPAATTEAELLEHITTLNADNAVDGILVQLPLPNHINEQSVIAAIDPAKDVDGFHVQNGGKLLAGTDSLVPCTPKGCMIMLKNTLGDDLSGKHAVVIGRSNIVGKPMALLLLQANATVTIAHSRTSNIEALCREADIIIAAVGRPEMVKKDWVKKGVTVIDVGINRLPATSEGGKGKLVGDVAFDEVAQVASAITPVPGGVGPMTIACLLDNTVDAAIARRGA